MILQLGYQYVARNGEIIEIIGKMLGDLEYPYVSAGRAYKEDGTYIGTSLASRDKDLIACYSSTGPQLKEFTKADNGKPMLSLIEPQFIISLGEILTFGAKKYSIDNWKLCEDPTRYKDALLRHTYAYLGGEIIDPESGIPHTACMAFNTMALQWFDNNTPS